MKRVILMASLSLIPRLLVAQEIDVSSLVGEDWYGLYLNGQKVGYSVEAVNVEEDGTVTVKDDAHFRLNMVGQNQDMRIYMKRTYTPEGDLKNIEQKVDDPAGAKKFDAFVEGNTLTLVTTVGGQSKEQTLPKPNESLRDALKLARLVGRSAKVGDEVRYSVFEPMYQKEVEGVSRIAAIEERVFQGAPTKVFRVASKFPDLGIDSDAVVAEDGTVLEDNLANIITMRLEPESVAQDVTYQNDVIVSNAAKVSTRIENPRNRDALQLRIRGPLAAEHSFCDERQTLKADGDAFAFEAKRVSLDGFKPAALPIENEEVAEWTKPSLFVQSNDPRLVSKAKEIAGEETDAFALVEKLCHWVYGNVRTTYTAQLSNALEVLDRLEGDCTEHSILFIGLARALGLPAREVAGLIYVDNGERGFYFHQWAKVWVGKWIDVDPTFNQPLADVTHVKLAEGDLFEQTKLIPIIGRLQIDVMETEDNG